MASMMDEAPAMNGTDNDQLPEEQSLGANGHAESQEPGQKQQENEHQPIAHRHNTDEPERRKSNRVRTSTQFYMAEPLPERPKPKSKKKKKQKDASSSKDKVTKTTSTTGGKKGNTKSSPFVISLKIPQNIHPPNFIPIESDIPDDIIWLRLTIREFFLRFERLCRLPTRHGSTINDPTVEWNEYLYKSLIVNLLRIILNDLVPLVPYTKEYLTEIEKTPADSERLWTLLYEYIDYSKVPPTTDQLAQQMTQDAFTTERTRLLSLNRVLMIATATETIRLTIDDDQVYMRQVQAETNEEVKRLKAQMEEKTLKMNKTQPKHAGPDMDRWQERFVSAKRTNSAKIQNAEDSGYFKCRKLNMRTFCLGKDTFGNQYWIFQQKSKEMRAWGSWVTCYKQASIVHPSGEKDVTSDNVDPKRRLYYVAGKEEILKLAKWIQSQYKANTSLQIVKDLRKFAEHLNDTQQQLQI